MILKTEAVVERLLRNNERLRNDDNALCLAVIEEVANQKGIDLNYYSISNYFHISKSCGFPSFETITRTRRRVQNKSPELQANRKVKAFRADMEEKFREYSRS